MTSRVLDSFQFVFVQLHYFSLVERIQCMSSRWQLCVKPLPCNFPVFSIDRLYKISGVAKADRLVASDLYIFCVTLADSAVFFIDMRKLLQKCWSYYYKLAIRCCSVRCLLLKSDHFNGCNSLNAATEKWDHYYLQTSRLFSNEVI